MRKRSLYANSCFFYLRMHTQAPHFELLFNEVLGLIKVSLILCGAICTLFLSTTSAQSAENLWIDSDPACGHNRTDDVDDCWALTLALNKNKLIISGISTVFGNKNGRITYDTTRKLVSQYGFQNTFRGADKKLDIKNPLDNNATQAIAKALKEKPHIILAIGPLTNIAILLLQHPELEKNIKQIIAVAGQRPDNLMGFYPGKSKLLHLHDMNFRKDVASFNVVLNSSIPLTLIPYEIAIKVAIGADDLEILSQGNQKARWLAEISRSWLTFWQDSLHTEGFSPFDSLAVGYLLYEGLYTCEKIPIAIQRKRALFTASRDKLIVDHKLNSSRLATYCYDIDLEFKKRLIEDIKR